MTTRQGQREILRIKAAVRHRDGYKCIDCGMTLSDHLAKYGKRLDVHRTTPGSPYTVEGCVTLCKGCHGPQPRRQRGEPDLANGPSVCLRLSADERALVTALQAAVKARTQLYRISQTDVVKMGLRALRDELLPGWKHEPKKGKK